MIALRHYDATGVLPPAMVDPASGYRYYARDQVPTAQLVRLLRQLDVAVDELPKVLARIEAGEDVLPELAASLDQRAARARSALDALHTRLSTGVQEMESRVRVRHDEEQAFLVTSARITRDEVMAFERAAHEQLYLAAARGPLTLPSSVFWRFHNMWDGTEPVLVDACLPYWLGGVEPRDLPDGVAAERYPAGRFAGLVVTGAETVYPAISAAYDAVAEWITRHGFEFNGPAHEVHRRWRGEIGHPDNVVEVGWWITE